MLLWNRHFWNYTKQIYTKHVVREASNHFFYLRRTTDNPNGLFYSCILNPLMQFDSTFPQQRSKDCDMMSFYGSKISPARTATRIYLLHLSRSAPEQLDVPLPQDLFVLLQGILGVFFTGEEHKGIAGGPSVRVLDKEQTFATICDRALGTKEGQHLLGCGGERQPPHTDNHLVLFGQELGHLVRRAWCQRTAIIKHLTSHDHPSDSLFSSKVHMFM